MLAVRVCLFFTKHETPIVHSPAFGTNTHASIHTEGVSPRKALSKTRSLSRFSPLLRCQGSASHVAFAILKCVFCVVGADRKSVV